MPRACPTGAAAGQPAAERSLPRHLTVLRFGAVTGRRREATRPSSPLGSPTRADAPIAKHPPEPCAPPGPQTGHKRGHPSGSRGRPVAVSRRSARTRSTVSTAFGAGCPGVDRQCGVAVPRWCLPSCRSDVSIRDSSAIVVVHPNVDGVVDDHWRLCLVRWQRHLRRRWRRRRDEQVAEVVVADSPAGG